MTSTERVWMTRQAHTRLKTELAALRSRPSIEVPEDFMDYDDNLVANYAARQARIHQIQDLLTNAVVGEDPPDDGIAEPGMVLTVRYDDTGEIETFLLGVRGAEDADIEVYSMQSPLGQRDRRRARPANSAPTPSPVGPTCPSRYSRRCPTECTRRNPRGDSLSHRDATSHPATCGATRRGGGPTTMRTPTTSRHARSAT